MAKPDLAESGFAVQRRRLDAYVLGCTERTLVYQQHARFVQDYQFWGHWAHKRRDAQGRIYYLSPEVVLGNAQGRPVGISRLRHVTRTVRRQGQIRLCNFGISVDRELWGHTVEVLIDDDRLRIEWAERVLVSYPCGYDTRQRRITAIDHAHRHQDQQRQAIQLGLFALDIVRMVWRMPFYHRAPWPRQALQAQQLTLFDHFTR